MKKLLLLTVLISIFGIALNAQNLSKNVLNGGFENWPVTSLGFAPDNYNSNSTIDGEIGLTRATGVNAQNGTYAVKLETVIDPVEGDTNSSYILMGTFNDEPTGGIAYTGQPDSLAFYAKYNVMPGDSAGVLVIIFNADTVTAMNIFWMSGNQNTYKRHSFPITDSLGTLLTAPADSLLIAAVSSQFFAKKAYPGSTLYLDNMSFIGTTPQMPNADFENWTEVTYSDPQSWESSNKTLLGQGITMATKSTDANSGSFALQITATEVIFQEDTGTGPYTDTIVISSITSQKSQNDDKGLEAIGIPYDVKSPISIEGWYKYTPSGIDTAFISFDFRLVGANITYAGGQLLASSTYKKFSFPVNSVTNSDSVIIYITAGSNDGSSLIIDDIIIIDSCSNLTMDIGSDTALCNVDSITFTADTGFDSYAWNGSTSDTNQNYSVATATIVSVIATNTNNCKFTDTVVVAFCASIADNVRDININIYPNPANNVINIITNASYTNTYTFELKDITGRLLITNSLNKNNQTINVSRLESGLYLLNIKDINGIILSTNKIILNK